MFLVIVSLPASVIAFNFAQGVVEYWAGTGVLRTMGYPGFEFPNLDPTSRAHWRTGGCMLRGYEPLTQVPYNLALRTLAFVFGPMPGSYDGPYPSEEDAWRRAKEDGVPLSLDSPLQGVSRLTGSAVSSEVVELVYENLRPLQGPPETTRLQALVLDERLLVLAGANEDEPLAYVVLIDLKGGTRVARYRLRNPSWVPPEARSP